MAARQGTERRLGTGGEDSEAELSVLSGGVWFGGGDACLGGRMTRPPRTLLAEARHEASVASPRDHGRRHRSGGAAGVTFRGGALSDLHGDGAARPVAERQFIPINTINKPLGEVMKRFGPQLWLRVPNALSGPAPDETELVLELAFHALSDFEPAAIVRQVPALRELLERRCQARELFGTGARKMPDRDRRTTIIDRRRACSRGHCRELDPRSAETVIGALTSTSEASRSRSPSPSATGS